MKKDKLNIKPGDKVRLCIKQDPRASNSGGDPERNMAGVVEKLYEHFALIKHPSGYRECFSYWELRRTMV